MQQYCTVRLDRLTTIPIFSSYLLKYGHMDYLMGIITVDYRLLTITKIINED